MKKLFRIVLVVLVFALTAAADSGNRFKNSAPDPLASNDDGLFTPAQFEAAMAARPDPSGKIFVSRCRFAPFSSTTTLYAPFAGTQTADATSSTRPTRTTSSPRPTSTASMAMRFM